MMSMNDLQIPFILWMAGDDPPDVSAFIEPISVPIRVHSSTAGPREQLPRRGTSRDETLD